MCLTCLFFSLPPSLLLSLSVSLSLSLSYLFLCVSVPLSASLVSLFSFCLLLFPVCLSLPPITLSHSVSHIRSVCFSLWLSLFDACMHACARMHTHTYIHTHTRDTYNTTCTDSQVKKGAMPARFVTTLLVTKYAGIAACFVTLVTKTCRSDKMCRNSCCAPQGDPNLPPWMVKY